MKKILILSLIISGCSYESNSSNISKENINEFVLDEIDYLWESLWAEDFDGIQDEIINLGKVCNSYPENELHFDIFVLCKALLFDFALKYLNDDEIYESDTKAIEEIFVESKEIINLIKTLDYTNESFYDFVEIIIDNYFAQNYLQNKIFDIDFIEDALNIIHIEDGGNFFKARENEIFSKLYKQKNQFSTSIDYIRKAISNYEIHHNEEHRDTLTSMHSLAELYFETDQIENAKETLIKIITKTTFKKFPTIHLKSWSLLSLIEVYHGNTKDEFLLRKIFFEKYFQAVKHLNLWNSEIDNIYLEEFAINLDFLNCEASEKAIDEFNQIKKVRDTKYGKGFINLAYYDINMQILKNNMLCSKSEKDYAYFEKEMVNSLNKNLNELYEPWQIYQFALYLNNLDSSKKNIKILHEKLAVKAQSVLEEIFDMIEKEEIENPFNQYLTDTIIFPLAFNLNLLNEDIRNNNFLYIKKIIDLYFASKNEEEIASQAFYNLRSELTTYLIEQSFYEEAIYYGRLFSDYENKLIKIDDLKIFKDEQLLNQSKVLTAGSDIDLNCSISKCDNKYNELINNISSYDKDPIFLALFLEKNNKNKISKYIQNEFYLLDQKNKYLSEAISYDIDEQSGNDVIESAILNNYERYFELSKKERREIQNFIYPELDIKDIRRNLNMDDLVISVSAFPLREKVITLIVYITKNEVNLKIFNQTYEENIVDKFSKLIDINSDVNNLPKVENVISLSKDISEKIFAYKEILKNKKQIFFTSNFHDVFNPNILYLNNDWLVKNFNVGYFLDWSNLTNQYKYNKNNKYIGYGDVDYSNHANAYVKLDETGLEINMSAKNFNSSENFLGKNVTEKNIFFEKANNAVVHFATHNTEIQKYGLSNVPALVIAKNGDGDGYLDAFEIQNINLSNSDIILSACSTLYAKNSENFSQLIRAFKISGSRSILATRWDIESQSAVNISSTYARNLSNGLTPHEAISEIQRDFISNSEYNHPSFWSAYMTVVN